MAADDITYGALLNGAPVERKPRPGMLVHRIGERHLAMQTAGAPHLLARLTALIGRPELTSDERFATPAARRSNWPALLAAVREWLDGFDSVDAAVQALCAARVPCVPMLSPEEVITHPQLAAREAFPAVTHPHRGPVRITAAPFQVDRRASRPAGPAPYRVGEHTRQVLSEVLGYSTQRIHALERERAIESAC